MRRAFYPVAVFLCAVALVPSVASGQSAAARMLFRVFLLDGRVLSSYGEWSRLDGRVIFSMPAQLTTDPLELHLVSIPAQRVDWPRTEAYADSVRGAAYAASRGDADFEAFSDEVAKALNDVAKNNEPAARLATAERARQKLAEWPASHYGYRATEVRTALGVLDEVIAQLRVGMGMSRFDLALSANAPMVMPPPPPLPPPTDAELAEEFVAAASLADTGAERISLLQTVMGLLDRAIGTLQSEWAARMRGSVTTDLERERRTEKAYEELRTRSLEEASKLASKGRKSDLEKLRDHVRQEDERLGGHRAGDVAAILATIDLQTATIFETRDARKEWERSAPAFRKYRRSTNESFKVFGDVMMALQQVKLMNGPPIDKLDALTKRFTRATRALSKVSPPEPLAAAHDVIASAADLADNAFRLRREAVSSNSMDVATRASSAAAGALMLYQRARADQLAVMEPPSSK